MILKKIPVDQDKAARKSKATNINDLTEYVAVPDDSARLTRLGYHIDADGVILGGNGEQPEKLLYLTTRGFNTSTFKGQQAEMVALSMECKKSKYPIQHWVASWPEDEQPTPEQVEELLDVFLEQLGLEKHQVIAALHKDTDNIHLHIAINKVNPDTYLVVKPAKGWWKEAAQRTVAIIEHRQGWRPERRARYTVMDDGTVARVGKLDGVPTVPTRAGDMENRTGQKSAARIAIEEAGELIRSASSWAELHQGLAERGMRYERAGGVGAHIYVGDQPVKASTAGHWCSLPKLTKRLGAFEPADPAVVPVERKPEPLRPDLPGWDDYISAAKHHRAQLAQKLREEKERYERELAQFRAQKAERSAAIAAQNWKGKGEFPMNRKVEVLVDGENTIDIDVTE